MVKSYPGRQRKRVHRGPFWVLPSWSYDGSKLAFVAAEEGDDPLDHRLYVWRPYLDRVDAFPYLGRGYIKPFLQDHQVQQWSVDGRFAIAALEGVLKEHEMMPHLADMEQLTLSPLEGEAIFGLEPYQLLRWWHTEKEGVAYTEVVSVDLLRGEAQPVWTLEGAARTVSPDGKHAVLCPPGPLRAEEECFIVKKGQTEVQYGLGDPPYSWRWVRYDPDFGWPEGLEVVDPSDFSVPKRMQRQ
ncbi:MAG: hypothetical protein AAGA56_05930 [Myxococcota bacterium]